MARVRSKLKNVSPASKLGFQTQTQTQANQEPSPQTTQLGAKRESALVESDDIFHSHSEDNIFQIISSRINRAVGRDALGKVSGK